MDILQAWGVAISGSILQNGLKTRLPTSILESSSGDGDIVFRIVSQIPSMPLELRVQVEAAFVDSMRLIWIVVAALCGLGLMTCVIMKDVALSTVTDKNWGLKGKEKTTSIEKGQEKPEFVVSSVPE